MSKIKITIVDQKGDKPCHRNCKINDTYDFDKDRGKMCPMALHVCFVYADILRYGGNFNGKKTIDISCPDVDTLNIYRIELIEEDQ
ncbi:MAG: TIGR04076 family protein [Erysipelotrichaceae bacterium]|nr:TIGR04076 family protein [Erysipelotrichaceae bacterium]MDY5251762.1 TIGR04076 family protein [Erysipelotrichaceae bacterium]